MQWISQKSKILLVENVYDEEEFNIEEKVYEKDKLESKILVVENMYEEDKDCIFVFDRYLS